jgi:hypothetical protein
MNKLDLIIVSIVIVAIVVAVTCAYAAISLAAQL